MNTILEAGVLAPSACNRQPWRYLIVRDGEARRKIAAGMREALNQDALETSHTLSPRELASIKGSAATIEQAPIIILVYCKKENSDNGSNWSLMVDMQGIGACIQNMLLAATSLGIASLWICDVLYFEGLIGRLLGMNEMDGCQLSAALALGYEDHYDRPEVIKHSPKDVTLKVL